MAEDGRLLTATQVWKLMDYKEPEHARASSNLRAGHARHRQHGNPSFTGPMRAALFESEADGTRIGVWPWVKSG